MSENVFADALVPDVDDPQFADLIETFTVPARVPLAPEIEMHLATHITPLWQATEDMLGVLDIPPPYWAFAWPGGQAITRYILGSLPPGITHGGLGSSLEEELQNLIVSIPCCNMQKCVAIHKILKHGRIRGNNRT